MIQVISELSEENFKSGKCFTGTVSTDDSGLSNLYMYKSLFYLVDIAYLDYECRYMLFVIDNCLNANDHY